ncbi:hypothetical protein MKW92_047614 [Papaver armeniacum]|nr:hypothetical protein MKW92_047614 [Papaver armeniacum]
MVNGILNIFKKKTAPKEALRESKREMSTATRGNKIWGFCFGERKLVNKIKKKTVKFGNEAATRILARQLVRLRQQITNLQGSRAQIRGVATHTQAMYASTAISTGMKGATKAMTAMNRQMAPTKQAKVFKEFQKQSSQMDMTVLKDFSVAAEAEVRSLASLYSVVGRLADVLALYFGEDSAHCPFEQDWR